MKRDLLVSSMVGSRAQDKGRVPQRQEGASEPAHATARPRAFVTIASGFASRRENCMENGGRAPESKSGANVMGLTAREREG